MEGRTTAALWLLLLALQLVDRGADAATLVSRAFHPKTRCCKRTDAIEPLKGIITLDACQAYCAKYNLQPIQLGEKTFACKRPKYACDKVGQGADCAECYQAGTCFLMPFVGGISLQRRTDVSKRRLAEQEQREKVYKEKGQGVRDTGLGGVLSLTGQKTGKASEDERRAEQVLTKSETTSLSTENFGGFPKGGPLNQKDFLAGAGDLGQFAGRVGRNGQIRQTNELELAKRKRLKDTQSQETNQQQENFAQDLGLLGPGQRGSFSSKSDKKELAQQRARRAETEQATTRSKKLALSGTAAEGFAGSSGGPVELLEQNQAVLGTESELREGSLVSAGTTKQNIRLAGRGGDLEIGSLERRSQDKAQTRTSIKGRSIGKGKLRQVATDVGLNQDLQTESLGERQTNTATKQAGNFVQLEKKGKKCDGCTSTLQKLTKGRTFGDSRERLQEQSKENKRSSLRGRAGEGATVVTTGRQTSRFRRAKQAGSGADVQEQYKGANSNLSPTGSVRGKVAGSVATRARKRSFETEEGLSTNDVKELDILGFPTTHKG